MLGERLGIGAGKVTGTRVLPSDGQQVWLEVSIQGEGTLLGQAITLLGTYKQTLQAGGVLRGEGHVLYMAADGAIADWVGGGVGQVIGAGFKASYGVYGAFQSAQGSLTQLTATANIGEYEVEEDGSFSFHLSAWTGARVPAANR